MSNYIDVMVIVEGKTEEIFINSLVQPYLAQKSIFMQATQISKPGQKGGDVRFSRAVKDFEIHLKQRSDTYVTTFIDYYGTKEWPGLDSVRSVKKPSKIAKIINDSTKAQVLELFPAQRADKRFVPFIAVHEFEALLFSNTEILSSQLGIDMSQIEEVLVKCGEPEAINNSPQTAPSKRLDLWSKDGKFPKTTAGIAIASKIGIKQIREKCPLFNAWLETFEKIQEDLNG
jgi:hypothetical protein